jgi:hypothetical protein
MPPLPPVQAHDRRNMQPMRKEISSMTDYDDEDDELALPERYIERAGETLAYRLMEYLEFLGVIGKDHVSYLRYPPIELIEDAEKALRDGI